MSLDTSRTEIRGRRGLLLVSVLLATALVTLGLPSVPAVAGDWSTIQNDPANTGVADEPVPSENLTVQWSYEPEGGVFATPALYDGSVYVGSFDEEFTEVVNVARRSTVDEDGLDGVGGKLYSVGLGDGVREWSLSTDGPVWASPTVSDDTVYVGTLAGGFYAVDASSGEIEWKTDIGSPLFSSPKISENGSLVYTAASHIRAHEMTGEEFPVVALDADTGERVWNVSVDEGVLSAPAVGYGLVYVGDRDGTLHALNGTTGERVWSYDTEGRVSVDPLVGTGGITASPTVRDGAVYFGNYAGMLYSVDATEGEEVWKRDFSGSSDSGSDGSERIPGSGFKFTQFGSSPAVTESLLYIGNYDGTFRAIDTGSGEVEWYTQKDSNFTKSSPIVADGSVVANSRYETLIFDGTTGEELRSMETQSRMKATPLVGDSRMILATTEGVYALGEGGDEIEEELENSIEDEGGNEVDTKREDRKRASGLDEDGLLHQYLGVGPSFVLTVLFPAIWFLAMAVYLAGKRRN